MSFTDNFLKELEKRKKKIDNIDVRSPYSGKDLTNSSYLEMVRQDDEEEDIAPLPDFSNDPLEKAIRKQQGAEEEEEGLDFFDAGSFSDGFQFSDIIKAPVATIADIASGIVEGVLNTGESIADFGFYLGEAASDLLGDGNAVEEWFDEKQEVAANRNFFDEWLGEFRDKTGISNNTLLGRTSQAATQGIGQAATFYSMGSLGQLAKLGTVGQTALTTGTVFASSSGSSIGEALSEGASDKDAMTYGLSVGAFDAVWEGLSGGLGRGLKAIGVSRGIGGLDDIFADKLTSKIANYWVKNAAQAGVKAAGEGLEEVLSGLSSAVLKKMTYMPEADLKELIKDENLLESFVVGALSSAPMQAGDVITSSKNKSNLVTGLNANEDAVVKKEVENRIAEAEKDGKKLSNRDKNDIYDGVVKDLDKGYISIDTINKTLGGDSYKAYIDAMANEDAELSEYESLLKKKESDYTKEDTLRFNDLQSRLDDIKNRTKSKELGTSMYESIFKNDTTGRLGLSYQDAARANEKFTVDLDSIDEKERETYKAAMESGAFNNSGRSHEAVSMMAKHAAKQGVKVNFTTEAKMMEEARAKYSESELKVIDSAIKGGLLDNLSSQKREAFIKSFAHGNAETEALLTKFGKDAYIAKYGNGFRNKSTGDITYKVGSQKGWRSTFGHEIMHSLEKTKHYDATKKALFAFSKKKGDFDTRRADIAGVYDGVYNSDIETDIDFELTADLAGDYIFTDSEFAEHLYNTDKNVFQKVFDEIKYWFKLATAGSEEARLLEKAKHNFEKALRSTFDGKASTSAEGGTQWSMTGVNSRTADKQKLANAETMLEQGIDSETIRKETGWFKSYDGKWRYEVDDSKAEWKIDSAKPDQHRLFYFGEKVYKLSDLLDHKELFEAYPQLKDVTVYSSPTIEHGNGSVVGRNTDSMSVGEVQNDTTTKWAIIHELQHIIQNIEGFARGSSKLEFTQKEWGDKEYDAFEKRNEVAKKLYNVLRRNGVSISNEAIYEEQNYGYGYKISDEIIESNYWTLSNLANRNKRTQALIDEYYEQVQILNATTPEGQYHNTAGEIEAYDTMARMRMTADERKAKRPNIDVPNAIVLGTEETGTSATWLSKNEADYDPETATLKEQLLNAQDALNKKDVVASANYEGRQFKNKAEAKKWVSNTLARWGGRIDRQNFGIIFFSKTDLDYAIEHIDDPYQQTALGLLPYVLKRGDIIGEHSSHKMRGKRTITIGAPIEVNGTRGNMGVVVNMNGKHAYSARVLLPDGSAFVFSDEIEKTSQGMHQGVLNVESLADTTSEVSDNSIAPLSGNVNTQFSLSSDTEGRELSSEQQDYFALAKTRDENGHLKPFYHGTRRADRVGTYFDPKRATSGPMAYFTDSKEIADHYAKDKADTSLAYDSDYDSYETQFRVNRNGKDMSVVDLWNTLSMSERNAIKEKAKHVTMDDDFENVIYDESTQHGLGNFDAYELNRHKGNALHTLVDSWLTDGNIFGEEHKFLDVLKLVGIEDATYKDPDFRDEKTYEVYLNITNPFDTSNISDEMIEAFKQAAEMADYAPGNQADMWDKSNITPEKWIEGLLDDIENGTTYTWTRIPDFVTDVLKEKGFDGIFDTGGKQGGATHTVAIPFYSEQIKSVDNRTPTSNVDINLSMSDADVAPTLYGDDVRGTDLMYREDIAPVAEATENVQETLPDDYAPMTEDEATVIENEALDGLTDEDAPPEYETPYYNVQRDAVTVDNKSLKEITKRTSEFLGLGRADQKILEGIIQNYSQNENLTRDDLYSELKKNFSVLEDYTTNDEVVQLKKHLKNMRLYVSDEVKLDFGSGADGYSRFLRSNFGKLKIVKDRASGVPVDSAYMELSDLYPSYFPEDIINPADQLRKISEMASMSAEEYYPMELSDAEIEAVTDMVYTDISDYMNEVRLTSATEASHAPISDSDAPMVEIKTEPENKVLSVKELYEQKKNNYRNTLAAYEVGKEKALANFSEAIGKKLDEYNGLRNKNTKKAHNLLQQIENLRLRRDNVQVDYANRIAKQQARLEAFESKDYSEFENKELAFRRKDLHKQIVDKTKAQFEAQGYDLDEVLRSAKDLSTIATVDNTPQRVMEKSLGYKEGQILSDITVNKVAQNETEGIKWLNSFTNKKDGLLAKISKQYNIKPGSKESAAAQMYAEGFYVDKENNVVQYGDTELAKDFPDAKVRENIKGLAKDQRIREIYDETLAKINESRARNAYPEIPKLDNYFLHFRAMDDTFSRLGLPFNPNDIRAKDLPTDLNGVTADLKPGQPYFSSAMHRRGQRTSFDLLGGLEKYLSSAKNQIYHIDDIQTLRALRNYIADSYGQANGLEGLDALDEDIAQEKIKQVYGAHLSTFAKFLNEEANVIAGKTALIDRGLEGIVGRRAMTFMDTVNRQVGSNMVGYNVSSALTNLIAPVQAFAKTNKYDFIKGFAQTVSNKVNGIKGKSDGFAEESPVMIRRKGEERFHRTAWQKLSDPGYALMGAVDNLSTEIIARAKYNELTRKGMDSETAHVETDKWVSRLMGDRSLGQQPQLYNSKVLGLVTKFQLEVRNQLDSQFYDTIKEAEASTEDIQNGLERNAKKAAKIASTFFTLAVGQHVFGKVFESIAGYNPAFDIISVIAKAFGWDDDEEDEDTVLDNIEQAFFELMGDMPYTSILEGGRIPISSALPIEQLYQGKDQYGNEKSRLETIKETLPYYLMPGGYGQLKKTTQGLEMFNDDHPISGSYTDSGKLRFPVEDTLEEMFRAGLFGQYASGNARDYFDNERDALDEKKTQEFIDSGISIQDYWDYREGLKGLTTINDKADYIYGLDLPIDVKNLFINNLTDREEDIDLSGMEGFEDFEEFDFAVKNPEKYEWLTENGITVAEYEAMDKDTKEEYNYAFRNPEKYEFLKEIGVSYSDFAASDDVTKEGYDWAFKNPDKYKMSQAITEDFGEFYSYKKAMNEFDAKDENGETVSGLKKQRVADYISSLDIEYGRKLLLFKSQYPSDDSYNKEIVEYLDSRSDISYEDMVTILSSLGFRVNGNTVSWD